MLDKEELVLVRLRLFLSPGDVLYPLICGYFPFTILAASSSRPQSQSQSEDYPLQSFSQPGGKKKKNKKKTTYNISHRWRKKKENTQNRKLYWI